MKNANFSALKPMLLTLAIIGVILSLCSVSLASDSGTGEEVIVVQEEQLTEEQVKNELNDLYKSLGKISNNHFTVVLGVLGSYLLVNYDMPQLIIERKNA